MLPELDDHEIDHGHFLCDRVVVGVSDFKAAFIVSTTATGPAPNSTTPAMTTTTPTQSTNQTTAKAPALSTTPAANGIPTSTTMKHG